MTAAEELRDMLSAWVKLPGQAFLVAINPVFAGIDLLDAMRNRHSGRQSATTRKQAQALTDTLGMKHEELWHYEGRAIVKPGMTMYALKENKCF